TSTNLTHRLDPIFAIIFFFSSRRRHTRFSRDWSSDVCSSDLLANSLIGLPDSTITANTCRAAIRPSPVVAWSRRMMWPDCSPPKIGRASCRDRVEKPEGLHSTVHKLYNNNSVEIALESVVIYE